MTAPKSGTFVMVDPAHVQALGPAAAVLYGRICWRSQQTGSWVASRATLATETGLTPAMIRRAVELLRGCGWVTATPSGDVGATLAWAPVNHGENDHGSGPISGEIRTGFVVDSAIPSLETGNTTTPPSSPPADEQTMLPFLSVVRPARDETAEHFERFWSLWPSGRKVGKPKAEAAFRKALGRSSVEAIAAGLHAHLPSWEARIAAGEANFVPHPATWLNRDGWADTPPPMPRAVVSGRASNYFASASLAGRGAELLASMNAAPPAIGGGA